MKVVNLTDITNALKATLNIEDITLTDDSFLHKSHQQFQSEKAYITVYISCNIKLPRLTIHRKIMSIVNNTCNIPVHAIAIKTKSPTNELE